MSVCRCIEYLRRLIDRAGRAAVRGIEHNFTSSLEHLDEALKDLHGLEVCLGASLPETRKHLEEARKHLKENRDSLAEEELLLAQWTAFREIRDKVCK